MHVSLSDIAKIANVSEATVSLALRNHERISVKRRHQIRSLAEKMNYQPNYLAQGLANGQTKTVAIILGGSQLEIAQKKAISMNETASLAGYKLLLSYNKGEKHRFLQAIREMLSRRVDGIIIYGGVFDEEDMNQISALNSNTPTVFLDSDICFPFPHNSVRNDKAAGMKVGIRYLHDMGHRHFYMLRHANDDWRKDQRIRAFFSGLAEVGLQTSKKLICDVCGPAYMDNEGSWIYNSIEIRKNTEKFIASHPDCTAIFCSNDIVAVSVLSTLLNLGIKVPDEISIVGIDNIPITLHTCPRLATIGQPVKKLVEASFELLLKNIENHNIEPENIVIPAEFIPRESTDTLKINNRNQ